MSLDGSNLSVIVPISFKASERTIRNLMNEYQSMENIELIFVAQSIRFSCHLLSDVIWIVDEPWNEVYEAHSIGVQYSSREIILFMDVNQHLTAATIHKFVQPILLGDADAVLNDMDYEYRKKRHPIPSIIFSQLTNYFINRSDLKIDSIMFLPYALTKQAIQLIDAKTLVNPVFTHVKLNQQGCRVSHHLPIRNIFKLQDKEWENRDNREILDYYLQAYVHCFNNHARSVYSDGGRRLDLLKSLIAGNEATMPLINSNEYYQPHARLSIIIPVQNEEKSIKEVLEECKKLDPLEIIVVVNQSNDRTALIAYESGATIIKYNEKLGLDTGRAVGAYFAMGDILLFIDGDFVIPAQDLRPFIEAIEQGGDVALNNQNHYLDDTNPLHLVTACKYAINLACQRGDLGAGSTVAVPHALSRKCVEAIGFESLANPALSYAMLLLNGFMVENIHHVNVNKMNRFRPASHYPNQKGSLAPTTSVIVGDHIEALTYLGKESHLRTKSEK